MREKAERAGRRRTPFLPGSSALWSEIALVVARQRGIYLAEDVDVFLGRERLLPGECRDTPVLRVRGGGLLSMLLPGIMNQSSTRTF